jgi:hypothetical protein
MTNEQHKITKDAPNQATQGQFYGDVNMGTQQKLSGECAFGIGSDFNASTTTAN